jgi:hypothetical protein
VSAAGRQEAASVISGSGRDPGWQKMSERCPGILSVSRRSFVFLAGSRSSICFNSRLINISSARRVTSAIPFQV